MLVCKCLKYPHDLSDPFSIREEVFVKEQGFTREFDEVDKRCLHLVLYDNDRPVACARVFPEKKGVWHAGRIAVVKDRRGCRLGARVLAEAEGVARQQGAKKMTISAQVRARGFYEKQGYRAVSGEYNDEDCPHVDMEKDLI